MMWGMMDAWTPLLLPVASVSGALLGFSAGLIPGLHMNNIAAALVANPTLAITFCSALSGLVASDDIGLLMSALIVGALVGHLFAEAVTSTYIGIPDGDMVSVLPAHRLARAGLGSLSVRSSADGCLVGILIGAVLLVPACLLMGEPIGLYGLLASGMGFIVLAFSALLVSADCRPLRRARLDPLKAARSLMLSCTIFLAAGVIGFVVFETNYYASPLPDFPWHRGSPVRPSSLLLPLFAGLFGIPGLMLSLRSDSREVMSPRPGEEVMPGPCAKDMLACVLGGAMVGWLPGMTSGSSATVCSSFRGFSLDSATVAGASRFVWFYSAVSSAGAVFALGAYFVLGRTRSGSMDAVSRFLCTPGEATRFLAYAEPLLSLVLAALVAGLIAHRLLGLLGPKLASVQHAVRSKGVSLCSIAFVCMLVAALTGTRGLLLLATASTLGLLTPLVGARRILLMGSLLLPITVSFFA